MTMGDFRMNQSPEQRAAALLNELTLDEKIGQVVSDLYFDVADDYDEKRDPLLGSYRNPGHFMHQNRALPATPAEVAERINADVRRSIEAQPHGIPPIENGEALHGAQCCMATNFPQPIGLASSFDPALVEEVGDAIGKECAAVGVRQVFSPVINLTRDCRWGRTVETYGEDVLLTGDLGAAMCRGLEKNGVIATPKHFVDNYGAGGRDSNYSETDERTLREVFLPPFRACVDAGAQSLMAAYTAWNGLPCSVNPCLLTKILREEWGFGGFVVSDYWGVEGVFERHRCALSTADAIAKALCAGLDVILPFKQFDTVKAALEQGLLTEAQLDQNVLRILTAKFRIGLFDEPYRDPAAANGIVRCEAHKQLALKAARESIVLLKNEGLLPLKKASVRRIGLFGESADLILIGTNYSGPYNAPWTGADAPTPLQALRAYLGDGVEVVFGKDSEIETLAPTCDVNLYFTTIVEGEGSDRSNLRLPSITRHKASESDGGLIVGAAQQSVAEDQEAAIRRLVEANPKTAVILINGAPIDMSAWIEKTPALIEAWYPGEQGARALAEILFGETNPSGKLPITIPKHVGQLPLFYSHKPSGRGYAYCDDDGKPCYPFGYGLSYTAFELSGAELALDDSGATVTFDVTNTGACDGAEVAQLYLSSFACDVVRPLKALSAYARVFVKAGETKRVSLRLPADRFCYYDAQMQYGLHDGCHALLLGTSSETVCARFGLQIKDGRLTPLQLQDAADSE